MKMSMKSGGFWLILLVVILVNWGGNHLNAWYMTLITGLLLGLSYKKGGLAFVSTLLASLLSWGGELVAQSFVAPVMPAANMIAGVMGFGTHAGNVVIVLSVVFGVLLALIGTWLGRAIQALFRHENSHKSYYAAR